MQRNIREEIKRSFLKLLDERPFSRITVKAIVEDCGVNRNSFYYYFDDIPTLLRDIAMEDAERLLAAYPGPGSLEECLDAAMRFAWENKRLVLHIYHSARRDLFEQYLIRICRDVVAAYWDKVYGGLPVNGEDREIMLRFYQGELVGQMLLWLDGGMKYDIRRQFRRLMALRRDLGEAMVRRSLQDGGSGP